MIIKSAVRFYLIFITLFTLLACKEEQIATVGDYAPEIATFNLSGEQVLLQQLKGKMIVLNFWSESCSVCIAELKRFDHIMKQYSNKVHFLAINIDGDNSNTAQVISKNQLSLPIVKDQLHITSERYGLIGTPTTFIIDPEGKILYKSEGLITEQTLTKLLTQHGRIK